MANPTETERDGEESLIEFDAERQAKAGIQVEAAIGGPLVERVWRTGRIALNEDRLVHLSPPVEGVIQSVTVRLGERVDPNKPLAVIDSREFSQAKFDLVRARQALEYAQTQEEWARTVSSNAQALLEALAKEPTVAELERQFQDRPIGDWRQQLLGAYAKRMQLKTQYESVARSGMGAVAEASVLRMKAEYDTAEATYHAIREEVRYQARRLASDAALKLREARTSEAIARAQLLLLGYSPEELERFDPLAEGSTASLFTLRTPIPGVVIEKHAVLRERVGPNFQMFQIADLSSVWVQADIFEEDLPLVQHLVGQSIRCRTSGGHQFSAQVFSKGNVLSATTRAATLLALADNAEGQLQPGMFVEVELHKPAGQAVQIPQTAVQRLGTQAFVFVKVGPTKFQRVDIELGRPADRWIEVKSGLKPGQQVVVAGGFLLKTEMLKEQIQGE